jgi:hypothetical protein
MYWKVWGWACESEPRNMSETKKLDASLGVAFAHATSLAEPYWAQVQGS